jgi:tetratricopeptide (TPR) repeat protein
MFYGWLGFSMQNSRGVRDSYHYLHKALQIGEETKSELVVCYACCWLSWTCAFMGLLDEAIALGDRAMEICKCFEEDQYLYYKSLGGVGDAYFFTGQKTKARDAGQAILEYSKQRGSIRGEVMGHYIMALSFNMDGDHQSAIQHARQGVEISMDPFYSFMGKQALGVAYLSNGQLQEGEDAWKEILSFGGEFAGGNSEIGARSILSMLAFLKGETQDLTAAEEALRELLSMGLKGVYVWMLSGLAAMLSIMAGVIPNGSQKAKDYCENAIGVAQEIGAKAFLGQSYLNLGLVCSAEGDKDKARQCITEAISLFEQCELENSLSQAKEALESLK